MGMDIKRRGYLETAIDEQLMEEIENIFLFIQ
jgi:hypothetical protein